MTVRAPGTPDAAALEAAPSTLWPQPSTRASAGIVIGGTPSGDVIVISPQALAIVRAGQLARAFIITGLETLRRTIALGAGRALRFEYGIYQLV